MGTIEGDSLYQNRRPNVGMWGDFSNINRHRTRASDVKVENRDHRKQKKPGGRKRA